MRQSIKIKSNLDARKSTTQLLDYASCTKVSGLTELVRERMFYWATQLYSDLLRYHDYHGDITTPEEFRCAMVALREVEVVLPGTDVAEFATRKYKNAEERAREVGRRNLLAVLPQ